MKIILGLFLCLGLAVSGLAQADKPQPKCPTLLVYSETNDFRKDTWVFSVRLENVEPDLKLTYKWTYYLHQKEREIKAGQGTKSITIDQVDLNLGITVWVVVGGLPEGCDNRAGETVIS